MPSLSLSLAPGWGMFCLKVVVGQRLPFQIRTPLFKYVANEQCTLVHPVDDSEASSVYHGNHLTLNALYGVQAFRSHSRTGAIPKHDRNDGRAKLPREETRHRGHQLYIFEPRVVLEESFFEGSRLACHSGVMKGFLEMSLERQVYKRYSVDKA